MKKLLLGIAVLALSACVTKPQNILLSETVVLTPPSETKAGYFRVLPKGQYFIDTDSIFVDDKVKELVHFEAVVNLSRGYHIYPKYPQEVAKSARQSKILNCKNHNLTRMNIDYYSEFWGEGMRVRVNYPGKRTISLQKGSTLDIIANVICANYYHH